MKRRPRLGLVGTSNWAVQVHGASAAAHPDVELVGVWGRDPRKTAQAAAALDTRHVEEWQSLLDGADLLSLAVPPDVQVPLATQAAARGVDLLLEKPLALDVAQARRLTAALGTVQTRIFLTRLWEPRTVAWTDELVRRGGWASGRAAFVNALSAGRLASSPWRVREGALWDVGPHAVAVLERVLGEVSQVRGAAAGADVLQLLLTHASGASSSVELSLTAAPAAAHTELAFWGQSGRSERAPHLGRDEVVAAHAAALTSLVRGADQPGPDAAYGLHITEVLAQAADLVPG